MTDGTTSGYKIDMEDLIITLFNDGSLMDVGTIHTSIMELLPTCYAVEYDGKEYAIEDEYFFDGMRNAKEVNIKILLPADDVHVERVDL